MMGRASLLLIPATIILLVFFGAFVVFAIAGFSPVADGSFRSFGHFTLSNYRLLFADPAATRILFMTMLFAAEITGVTVLLGYPLAYLMARATRAEVRTLFLGLMVLTFLTSSISRTYGWLLILGRQGLVNKLLLWTGWTDQPVALVYNETGVFIALVHFTLPYFVLTVFGSIRGVAPQLEEAARDLGANAIQTFFKVTVPITLPAIIGASALVFSLAISAFVFPLLLGGGRMRLISNFIYDQIFVSFNVPLAAAASSIFLTVVLAILLLFRIVELLFRHNFTRRFVA